MPLVYQHNINEHSKIGLWHITEPESFFLKRVKLQIPITHQHKRLQHLAGRYLLKTLYPDFPLELIKIADTRKPFIPDEPYHFSISHCGDYAAVIVSTKNRVGVDIEIPTPKILRIRSKFLTDEELKILMDLNSYPELILTMAWSIKEAMFKWYAEGGIDFKKHLLIKSVQFENDHLQASTILAKDGEIALNIEGIILEGLCLCVVLSDPK